MSDESSDGSSGFSLGPDGDRVDSFTEVTTTGFFSRIAGSVVGVLIGILLFGGAFVVLYLNEGRTDTGNLAGTASEVNPASPNPAANGKLVSLTGPLSTDETVGDNLYLRPGNYLAVARKVEMYAWVEEQSSRTKTNVGGSQTTETTYTYEKQWVENPARSSGFRQSPGHENPAKALDAAETRARSAQLGAYSLDLNGIDLPSFSPVALSPENTMDAPGAVLAGSSSLFQGRGSPEAPQVGDLRISYSAVNSGINVTLFGRQAGTTIGPFVDRGNNRLFRAFAGTRAQAIGQLHTEFTVVTWVLRVAGFLMLWIGLNLVFGPISTLLDIVPIFGSISRGVTGLITFFVALGLTVVTVIVSILLHHIVALLIALLVAAALVAGLAWCAKSRGRMPRLKVGSG